MEFTWSVDGPETGDGYSSPPVHPWDRDEHPTGPLWAVVELWDIRVCFCPGYVSHSNSNQTVQMLLLI